jgi:hypothetical protein
MIKQSQNLGLESGETVKKIFELNLSEDLMELLKKQPELAQDLDDILTELKGLGEYSNQTLTKGISYTVIVGGGGNGGGGGGGLAEAVATAPPPVRQGPLARLAFWRRGNPDGGKGVYAHIRRHIGGTPLTPRTHIGIAARFNTHQRHRHIPLCWKHDGVFPCDVGNFTDNYRHRERCLSEAVICEGDDA